MRLDHLLSKEIIPGESRGEKQLPNCIWDCGNANNKCSARARNEQSKEPTSRRRGVLRYVEDEMRRATQQCEVNSARRKNPIGRLRLVYCLVFRDREILEKSKSLRFNNFRQHGFFSMQRSGPVAQVVRAHA